MATLTGLSAEERRKRKKRKQIMKVVIPLAFLVLLAGLVVGIHFVNRYNEQKRLEELAAQTTAAPKKSDLVMLSTDDIDEITVISADSVSGEEKTFIRSGEDRAWKWKNNTSLELNKTLIGGLVDNVAQITSINTVSDDLESNSEVYGLKDPAHTVKIRTTEGEEIEIHVGSKSPSGTYYFMAVKGDNHIYMLGPTLYSYLVRELAEYIELEKFPELEEQQFDSLSVKKPGETEAICGYYNPGDLLQVDRMALSLWYFASETSGRYDSMDYEKGRSLNEAILGVSYSGCVRAMPTEEELKEFGLKDDATKIALTYKKYGVEVQPDGSLPFERKQIRLTIGKEMKYNDMTYYYAQLDGAGPVFRILKKGGMDFVMESFTKENMMTLLPTQIGIANVDRIKLIYKSKEHDFEIRRETTKDENGQETTVERFFGDGIEFEDSSFRTFYSMLAALSANQYLPPEKVKKDAEVILDYEFFTNYGENETKHIRLLEYDDNASQLEINGEILYLVNRTERKKIESNIDSILSALE
ncbi:MAG: DUF4340 domain-containing protein [Lachnospiraceae bacterium]|nr:DUF4340 domain-containing protein [Lachnospiraceae bacterium]